MGLINPSITGIDCLYIPHMPDGVSVTDKQWEHFAHQADVGIRGKGSCLAEAFEQVAVALTAVVTPPAGITPEIPVSIECSAENSELLLINWLNAVIYEMATRQMVFGKFEVKTDGLTLTGTAWGERINPDKHQPAVEVKAATYNQLSVKNENGRWTAQCVVDV